MEEKQASGLSREQKMFALIAEHEASTMTVTDFCELYDLSPGMYYYWQKRLKDAVKFFTLLKPEEKAMPATGGIAQ